MLRYGNNGGTLCPYIGHSIRGASVLRLHWPRRASYNQHGRQGLQPGSQIKRSASDFTVSSAAMAGSLQRPFLHHMPLQPLTVVAVGEVTRFARSPSSLLICSIVASGLQGIQTKMAAKVYAQPVRNPPLFPISLAA